MPEHDFRSSNDGNSVFKKYTRFHLTYQKIFESAQPVKVDFKFSEKIPAGIYGYGLLLTNKLAQTENECSIYFKSNFFTTLSFSFIVTSVFSSEASLYRSGKLSV